MAILAAPGPDDHDHSPVEHTDRRDPLLAIIEAVVDELKLASIDHSPRIREIEAAFGQGSRALGGIVDDRQFM